MVTKREYGQLSHNGHLAKTDSKRRSQPFFFPFSCLAIRRTHSSLPKGVRFSGVRLVVPGSKLSVFEGADCMTFKHNILTGKTRDRYKEGKYPENMEKIVVCNTSPLEADVSFCFQQDSTAATFILDPPNMKLKPGESQVSCHS